MEANRKMVKALLDGKTTGEAHQIYIDSCNEQIEEIQRTIRADGKTIKVLQETRSRLIDAKEALGHSTYDSLFNWLLEQVGH